jgi:hypothetical protein
MKWKKLQDDYKSQHHLCNYLQDNQYSTRQEWAAPWTSQYRHYGTITTSPIEGMHKVLKDYIMTSSGDFLRVTLRIKEMVLNQYQKYMKSIASARHHIKFEHKPERMPYLPQDIQNIITPYAIEQVRQQDLLRQRDLQEYRQYTLCTGKFETIYGLPCRHTIESVMNIRQTLGLNHFNDDHWRYLRQDGQSIHILPRPYQHIQAPIPITTKGQQRQDTSTRRDPSSWEYPVLPSVVQQPYQTLADILQQTSSAFLPTESPTPVHMSIPVTVPLSISIPLTLSLSCNIVSYSWSYFRS